MAVVTGIEEAMVIREDDINSIFKTMGEDIYVAYESIVKNGDRLHAYLICQEGCRVSPILYYDRNWWCKTDLEIAEYARDIFYNHRAKAEAINAESINEKYILTHIMPRLISAEKIANLEEEGRAYDRFLDLAIIYYLPLRDEDADGYFPSIRVTEDMLSYKTGYGIRGQIKDFALKNLVAQSKVMSMDNFLGMYDPNCNTGVPMYIATNKQQINGAATMISTDILETIREKVGSDRLVILPSSIHEVIVIPYNDGMSIPDLQDMVRQINQTVVSDDERLTDSVYIWDGHQVEIAS